MHTLETTRLNYLDATRACALLLGVIFHASLSFMPMFIGWAVMDVNTSDYVPIFVLISHTFRMELFFLLAGFFSHKSFYQHGSRAFFQSRVMRIVVPFIIGWFLLRVLLVSGWTMGAESMRGDVNILAGLYAGVHSLSELPHNLFVGSHLWFLYYLILMYIIVFIFRYLVSLHQPLQQNLTLIADKLIQWLCTSKLAITGFIIPTVMCLWFMNSWGVDTPDKSLVPQPSVAMLYGIFFLFGWLLHRQTKLVAHFSKLTIARFILCILAISGLLLSVGYETNVNHSEYTLLKLGFMVCYAIVMWTLVAMSIGLCRCVFSKSNKFIRYIADASYWIYLIHLPIVIWLQIAFAELPIHWFVKFVCVSMITILMSLILYDLCVRHTFIGAVLNGKRKTRILSKQAGQT